MTDVQFPRKQKSRKGLLTPSQICFGWFSLFCLFLILKNTEIAMEYMNRGLRLCAKTVIPTLFPFMVISELIVSGGIGAAILRPIAPFMQKILRLPPVGCCGVILGMLCGFPVGAKCAVRALESKQLTREEAESVLIYSTNPSSAFLINAVGVSLWSNRAFGSALYAAVLLSQLLVGLLFSRLLQKNADAPPLQAISNRPIANNANRGAKQFTNAVASSCSGILLVCAYVIFFSALVGTLNLVLERLGVSGIGKALIFGIFELSGGVNAASTLSSPVSALLAAFAVGWAGLSVHCQLLALCDGHGLRFRAYFLAKLLQGAVCLALFWLMLRWNPSLLIPARAC